jgi:hypothetical protein
VTSARSVWALLLGVEAPIPADNLFDLLRADVGYCSTVATIEQAAALQGVSVAELTNKAASWQGNAKPDFFGPNFGAAWAGTPEEAAQAKRAQSYTEWMRKQIHGE